MIYEDKLTKLLQVSRAVIEISVIDSMIVASIPKLGEGYFIADGDTITKALIRLNTIVSVFMDEHKDWQEHLAGKEVQ